MQTPRQKRFVSRLYLWAFLLMMSCALWMGFLRILLVIPTPADLDYEHRYFSPLPATLFVQFFRANARLLSWHPWMQQDRYTMSFTDTGGFSGPTEGCESFSGMYLDIAPGLLWGSYVHWEVREI